MTGARTARGPALARALSLWRRHALNVLDDPASSESLRRLAWRFLRQWGLGV